jgi:hypothetical protein
LLLRWPSDKFGVFNGKEPRDGIYDDIIRVHRPCPGPKLSRASEI